MILARVVRKNSTGEVLEVLSTSGSALDILVAGPSSEIYEVEIPEGAGAVTLSRVDRTVQTVSLSQGEKESVAVSGADVYLIYGPVDCVGAVLVYKPNGVIVPLERVETIAKPNQFAIYDYQYWAISLPSGANVAGYEAKFILSSPES